MRHAVYLLLVSILFISTCDVLEVGGYPEYPQKIEPLSLNDLEFLNNKYQEENNNRICSTLNEFGFTGFSRVLFPNNINPCLAKNIVRIELNNTDDLIKIAKLAVAKNYEYSNIADTSRLEVDKVEPLFGCTICEGPLINSVPIEFKIIFKNQQIEKIDVKNSDITVFVDAFGVNRIWGNWFPEFRTPSLINVGYIQAKAIVKGWEIDMSRITGENYLFKVTDDNLVDEPTFEFLPFINNGVLELRKTWKVPISYKDDTYEGWNANVDVFDGRLLTIEPKQI